MIHKRIICLLLVLAMLWGIMPVTTFAAEENAATETAAPAQHSHSYENGVCTACGDTLAGKTISILGDSISTFTGVSNDTSVNATLKGGAIYYSPGTLGVNRADTWWQQVVDVLDLRLLVNNAWSGSCILHTRSGTVGAYVDRCVQLHNDRTGEEPDIIAVFLGTNDFSYYQSALGTANIDYDTLITLGSDGTYTYAQPATTCEAYAVMLHKMTQRYPDAEVYCMNLLPRRAVDYTGDSITDVGQPTAFNKELAKVIEHFGCTVVDLENCGIPNDVANFDLYMGDKRVHPNAAGMDKMTQAVIDAILDKENASFTVISDLTNVTANTSGGIVLSGEYFCATLTAAEGFDELNVKVTMDGTDITESCYADGKITISSVTGDVVIIADAELDDTPDNYRWDLQGSSFVCTEGENNLTQKAGTIANGVINNAYFQLEKPVVLRHDMPWMVQWQCAGDWSGLLLSEKSAVNTDGNNYLFRTYNATKLLAFGESRDGRNHNYGIALADFGIDATLQHTYRVENRIDSDGSNMAFLIVDGVELGAMNHYYIGGTSNQGKTVDWLNGRDFCFFYVGANGHTINNCDLEYLAVTECTHNYENGICTGCGAAEPNPYAGKTIACVGDSITYGVGVTKDETDYVTLLAQSLEMDYLRLGASGTTLCAGGHATCNIGKLTEGNLAGADVVTILMGINDFVQARAGYYTLGTIDSTDTSTIYGAAHMWCQRIVELRQTESLKDTKFYFLTPVITSWNNSVSSVRNWDQSKKNMHGYTLRDLCNAIIEVCALYDIPVIDLNLISGLYYNSAEDNTVTEFGGDGAHPGVVGHQMMADAIENRLLQNHLRRDHDHSYGSWITTRYPDCVAGEQQRVCSVCTATERKKLDGKGHTYENGICTGCGEAAPPLEGRTISILGASISTYQGTSNGAAANTTNSTVANNVKYYPNTTIPEVTLHDTWWMQACNDLGLRLLVNNSWSGSSLLHTRNGTVGAYVDRCVQLHDDTGDNAGEEPDIICIQLGTNDFQYYKDTLGTADIDYDALIAENEDGSYTYATPVTSLEAAAIVLHKISVRYPNAEVYYLNISQRVDGTDELIQSFNAELKKVVEHFGAHIVDIYGSAITMDDFDTYIGDGRVHPNKMGMDAYTEAFKRALLENTACEVDTHTVSVKLDGVTADYGDDKIVVSGKSYVVNLSAAANMGLHVTVTMSDKDVTAAVYANGTVTIDAVIDDVVITAKALYEPKDYRWEFDGTDLTCVSGDNALTKNAGTTTNGVFSKTRYALEKEVVLLHDLPWAVEWKSEGTFLNTNGSSGARIFTSDDVNANYNARYIFKSNTNGIIAMGEKDTKGSHNYGIALADHGIDWTELHTYRLENRIAADGSNMVWLYVDGNEIGPMNHYYVGTTDKNTTSDWLSGKDFVFPYMGTDTHGFTNASIEYIQVTECVHSYKNGLCTACGTEYPNQAKLEGKVISIMGDSISTFAGYIPVADGFNREHLARYPQDDLLTDVKETWWMQVIDQLDAKLGINDSWRGATLSGAVPVTTGDTGENAAMSNLIRIQNLGSNGTPDVILLYGGTNDLAHVSKVGTFDPAAAPTEVDLTTRKWDNLADGFVHTLLRMRHYYPEAIIVAMLPTYTASYYSNEKLAEGNAVMTEICKHYNVPYVDLRGSGVTAAHLPDGIHPGEAGMDLITQAVVDALLSQCEAEPGENVVYSVKHNLSNVAASLGHYKGITAGKAFEEYLTGENMTVTVTMGGADITDTCYTDGKIRIDAVSGDLVITAKSVFSLDGRLQQLPEEYLGVNLWPILRHDADYYSADGWAVHPSGKVRSVTIPVTEGQQIYASSFGAVSQNGGIIDGIRVTFFSEDGLLVSMTAPEVYEEFSRNGCITVPANAFAVSIPMWTDDSSWELYILGSGDAGLLGDLDLDADVDSDDLTLLARHVGGIEPVEDTQALTNCDVNGDGEINSDDLTKHARYVGGIITDWDDE